MLAITGVTGNMGGRIAAILRRRGMPFVALARDVDKAVRLDLGAQEVREADYREPAGVAEALAGVSSLFVTSLPVAADRYDAQRSFIEAAGRTGVRRLIYLSFLNAELQSPYFNQQDHARTEAVIQASGKAFSILRSGYYMDYPFFIAAPDGTLYGGFGEGRISFARRQDIAEAAAAVLADDEHAGRTYTLAGEPPLTFREVARIMSKGLGRPYAYVDETWPESKARLEMMGAPDLYVRLSEGFYQAVREGRLAAGRSDLPALLGRSPSTLATMIAENAGSALAA